MIKYCCIANGVDIPIRIVLMHSVSKHCSDIQVVGSEACSDLNLRGPVDRTEAFDPVCTYLSNTKLQINFSHPQIKPPIHPGQRTAAITRHRMTKCKY